MLLPLAHPAAAPAAQTALTPSLSVMQEYTDNLFTSSSHRFQTFISHARPGIRVTGRNELLSGSLAARLDALHYSRDSQMDKVDQIYEGNGTWRLTPLLALAADASYRRESWPDREIESSGQPLSSASRRHNYGARAERRVGELTSVLLDYRYERIDYARDDALSDVTVQSLGAALGYDAQRLLSLLKLRCALRFSRSEYTASLTENYELSVGGSMQLNELWSFSVDTGGRYTKTELQGASLPTYSMAHHGAGWTFRGALDYTGEKFNGSLAYARELSNASGSYGTSVERNIVTLNLRQRISYQLFALAGAGYYRSKADAVSALLGNADESSVRGSLSLRYEFNRSFTADLGYECFLLDNESPAGTAFRNKLFVQLTARTDLFE
ncbi:porin family protein [Geomonas oryzae]|uniref:hypothetical protein n=1 Tax=Geomonas oryzae TaxID=2364273 RepID=UPI00100B4602|nr:hypothetical protein [Geomonas oryzae]